MSTINKDGWTYNENWNFLCFLMRETKENDLKDVENLKKALGRILSSMGTRFGRRFITYDIENCESTVTDKYREAVDREVMFPENIEGAIVPVNEVKDVQGRKLFEDDIEGGITGETSGVKVDDHNEGGTSGAAPGELVD
ncbi:hypothetical protein ACJIZ3_021347 [Penstemon smallii]|uniref:Uncharacterized protein n=1 Tax=Penstemon smallii TaxID=265156 RepID=A0ABD3SLV3_9LAMI